MSADKEFADKMAACAATAEDNGIIIYIDGSAIPNPGFIGSGIHGYMFIRKLDEGKKEPMARDHHITDRGYIHPKNYQPARQVLENEELAGTNAKPKKRLHNPVTPIAYFDAALSYPHQGTNNVAELNAFKLTLEKIKGLGAKTLEFFTDSEYVMMGVNERCKYWERNDWKDRNGNPIKNLQLWRETWALVQEVKTSGVKLSVGWVKGHNGVMGNVQADALALVGTNRSRENMTENTFTVDIQVKSYWTPDVDTHPFLHHKFMYMNTSRQFDIPGRYFIADDSATGLVIGSRKPETGFCVLMMKEETQPIKAVKEKNFKLFGINNQIAKVRIDNIHSKDTYPLLKKFGHFCLTESKQRGMITDGYDNVVSELVNTTGLTIRGIETFSFLEDLLNRVMALKGLPDKPNNTHDMLNWHDVTSTFFDTQEKTVKGEVVQKLVFKTDLVVGTKAMTIPIVEQVNGREHEIKVPVNLGSDLPPRNNLKNLEGDHPKVYLITWRESDVSIRYAFVIDCDSGHGIWSNHYADKIFLNI